MKGCLFCLKCCPDFPAVPDGGIVGAVKCASLEKCLYQHFIISKLLEVPTVSSATFLTRQKTVDDFLVNKGGIGICPKCAVKVEEAWEVHQKLLGLETRLKELKQELKDVMMGTIKNKLRRKDVVCVENDIRRLLFPVEMNVLKTDINSLIKPKPFQSKVVILPSAASPSLSFNNDTEPGVNNDVHFADEGDEDIAVIEVKPPPKRKWKRLPPNAATKLRNNSILAIRNRWRKRGLNLHCGPVRPVQSSSGRAHIKEVKRLFGFQCETCPSKFQDEQDFKNHNEFHIRSRELGLECTVCFYPAGNADDLDRHKFNKHEFVTPKRDFKCGKCEFTSRVWNLLKSHADKEHPDAPAEELGADVLMQCALCSNKQFETTSGLMKHQLWTHPELYGVAVKPVKCDHCEVVVPTEILLKYHIRQVHKRLQNFVCDICGKGFGAKKSMENHLKTHNPEKKENAVHICHICGCSYSHERSLTKHITKFHPDRNEDGSSSGVVVETDEFPCKYCDLTFPYKIALINHMRSHNSVQCPLCPRKYMNESGLRNHMKINHSTKNEEVPCRYCKKMFPNSASLSGHVLKHCMMKKLSEQGLGVTSTAAAAASGNETNNYTEAGGSMTDIKIPLPTNGASQQQATSHVQYQHGQTLFHNMPSLCAVTPEHVPEESIKFDSHEASYGIQTPHHVYAQTQAHLSHPNQID